MYIAKKLTAMKKVKMSTGVEKRKIDESKGDNVSSSKTGKVPASFEPVGPDYLDPEYKAPDNIFRFDPRISGHRARYYCKWGEQPRTYISITSVTSALIAKGPGFYRWVQSQARQGRDSETVAEELAMFGTIYHKYALGPILTNTGFDFESLPLKDKRTGYTNFQMLFPEGYRENAGKYYSSFVKGLMSFYEFVKQRVVKTIAVEIPMVSDKYGFAGTLDFVPVIRFGKKDQLAIVDLKSKVLSIADKGTDKTFYPEHRLQLELQKKLLVENYPHMIDKYANGDPENILLFNFAPKNWRVDKKKNEEGEFEITGGPSYQLENQTDNEFNKTVKIPGTRKLIKGVDLLLGLVDLYEMESPPDKVMSFGGSFENIDKFDWTNHVELFDL